MSGPKSVTTSHVGGEAVFRSTLRATRVLIRGAHREFVFARALARFGRDPARAIAESQGVLNDLIYGWGNEGWSAHNQYLVACILFGLVMTFYYLGRTAVPLILPIPIVPAFVTGFIWLYLLTVMARILGILYFVNRERFGWYNT